MQAHQIMSTMVGSMPRRPDTGASRSTLRRVPASAQAYVAAASKATRPVVDMCCNSHSIILTARSSTCTGSAQSGGAAALLDVAEDDDEDVAEDDDEDDAEKDASDPDDEDVAEDDAVDDASDPDAEDDAEDDAVDDAVDDGEDPNTWLQKQHWAFSTSRPVLPGSATFQKSWA